LDLTQPGRHLVLTFDDGGKSAIRAAEQLSQRGWRGHFFVVTSLIGRRTFLGRDEIRQLHGWGHTIGSHSHSHPNIFRELPRHRMLDEWRVSSAVLSDLLGAPCTTASVPGGEISGAVLASAAESGLGFLFTVEPQLRPRQVNGCWVLGRSLVKGRTPISRLDDLVHFRGWTRALALRQLKGLARRAFPLFYRRLVERRTREWQSSEEPMDPVESAR
jgi:peptidoglycan/xylan/chitin deacetylase (PgdA/CDA1 family)